MTENAFCRDRRRQSVYFRTALNVSVRRIQRTKSVPKRRSYHSRISMNEVVFDFGLTFGLRTARFKSHALDFGSFQRTCTSTGCRGYRARRVFFRRVCLPPGWFDCTQERDDHCVLCTLRHRTYKRMPGGGIRVSWR